MKGSAVPKSTKEIVVSVSARLGLLRNGLRADRITKFISVCVPREEGGEFRVRSTVIHLTADFILMFSLTLSTLQLLIESDRISFCNSRQSAF